MPKPPALSKFRKLVDNISRIYETARQAQVRFAWEIGECIVEIEQDGDIRAQYGSRLLEELSNALSKKFGAGFSRANIAYMRRFYLENKKIQPARQLTWTNHVELLRIKDPKVRKALEARALKEGLGKYEVRRLVTKVNRGNNKENDRPPLKRPADLKLNTFAKSVLKVKLADNCVLLDCGFFVSWPVKKAQLKKLTILDEPSYTYAATVDRVIDGDTLLVLIEVGFGIIVRDKLRLRGVDTSELGTQAGDRAKRFVEKILPSGSTIILKSHKCTTDNYGRFVADVFYTQGAVDANGILKNSLYLNQELLDQGHAVRMKE